MIRPFHEDRDDVLGGDPVLSEHLRVLDPATEDPSYWLRFRSSVMTEAARALAQRRLMADITISDVLTSWGRAVVPAALAAAAAGIMLLRAGSVEAPIPTLEQPVPVAELYEAPALLAPEQAAGFVALGPEGF
jgi:hypothetical protein